MEAEGSGVQGQPGYRMQGGDDGVGGYVYESIPLCVLSTSGTCIVWCANQAPSSHAEE